MWRVFSRHNDNDYDDDYDVDNDDVAPRLTWLMGISGETEQLSSPARALASLSPAAPNFGTFCIRVWKKRVYLYSSVFIFICSIWCQCKIVTCFRSYFDLNRFKFVQKIAKSSKRLKREPWPGALLPGGPVLPYTPAARPLIKKLCETIPRFPLKFQLPTPWLQKSSIGGIVTTKSNSSHIWSVKLTSLIFPAMFRIAQRLPPFEREDILLLLPWKVFFTRTRSDLIFVFLSRSLIKLTQIPTPLCVHPHELHTIL